MRNVSKQRNTRNTSPIAASSLLATGDMRAGEVGVVRVVSRD